ncbi:unnamed protein product, partial [Mesorhabditis spiculigera]
MGTDRAFERNDDEGFWNIDDEQLRPWAYTSNAPIVTSTVAETDEKATEKTTTTTTEAPTTVSEAPKKPDEVQKLLTDAVSDISNLTQALEEEHGEADGKNRTILWLDAKWKAEDQQMNLSATAECQAWRAQWERENNVTVVEKVEEAAATNETSSEITQEELNLVESELVDKKKRLKELGMDEELLKDYKAVGVIWKEVCGLHERNLWFRKTEDAKKIGVTELSPICEPFKEELNPDTSKLAQLAERLNEIVFNATELGIHLFNGTNSTGELIDETLEVGILSDSLDTADADKDISWGGADPKDEDWSWNEAQSHRVVRVRPGVLLRVKRMAVEVKEEVKSEEWADEKPEPRDSGESSTEVLVVDEEGKPLNGSGKPNRFFHRWIEIDATEETSPTLSFLAPEALEALGLDVPAEAYKRYEKVSLYLPGICAEYVPKAVDEFDSSNFEGVEIEGPIGVNITALEAAGVNLTALAEKLRNDTEVDDILSRTNGSVR